MQFACKGHLADFSLPMRQRANPLPPYLARWRPLGRAIDNAIRHAEYRTLGATGRTAYGDRLEFRYRIVFSLAGLPRETAQ